MDAGEYTFSMREILPVESRGESEATATDTERHR